MEIIGHRGVNGYLPENTLVSIDRAIQLGVDSIEIDVHVCKSGELVVIHYKSIDRTTNFSGFVRELSLLELKNRSKIGFEIPTLKEVLFFCEGKCSIHIELKGKGTVQEVVQLVTNLVCDERWSYDNLFISSFKLSRLRKVRELNSNIKIGLITKKKISKVLNLALSKKYWALYIHHTSINKGHVTAATNKNIRIYAWTVNKPETMRKLRVGGVTGIISDYPDLI